MAVMSARRSSDRIPRGLLAVCVVVAALAATPVVVTIVQALQGGAHAAGHVLTNRSTPGLLLRTVGVAFIGAPIAAIIGLGSAWLIERTRLPARRFWTVVVVAPLAVPVFVTSYAYAYLSGFLQGFWGAVAILAFSYYPIVFLLVAASLRVLDPTLEESARSLGLGGWTTFRRVVFPQLRPALYGGLLLILLSSLVEYDAFVAFHFQTFTISIFNQYRLSFSASGAAALSTFSIVLCVAILVGETLLRGGANYTKIGSGSRRPATRQALGRGTAPALGAMLLLAAISLGIPLGMLAYWGSHASKAAIAGAAADLRYLAPATLTSVLLGVGVAVVATILALPLAILAVRHNGPVVTGLERSVYIAFALPDLVAAIALSYVASHVVPFLYGGLFLLILAEAILFLPFALVALRTTLGLIEPALEESARALGLGALRTLWRVTIPLARPGLAAAGVLVFAFTLGDLTTPQVLLPPGMYNLGTQFYEDSRTVSFAAAAPYGAVMVGLAMLVTFVLVTQFGRVRRLEAS
jgi:iron(III) transport system permease protein